MVFPTCEPELQLRDQRPPSLRHPSAVSHRVRPAHADRRAGPSTRTGSSPGATTKGQAPSAGTRWYCADHSAGSSPWPPAPDLVDATHSPTAARSTVLAQDPGTPCDRGWPAPQLHARAPASTAAAYNDAQSPYRRAIFKELLPSVDRPGCQRLSVYRKPSAAAGSAG